MTVSEKDYLEARRKRTERRNQIFGIISIIGFVGSSAFAAVPLFEQTVESTKLEVSVETSLKQQEQGYQSVLQREPNNTTALEGLVRVRTSLKDKKGAIAALEKLVQLNPQREDYKTVLEQLQKETGKK